MTASSPKGSRRAVITGLGFTTCLGRDHQTVASALRDLRPGIRPVVFFPDGACRVRVLGTVEEFSFPSPNPLSWTFPEGQTIPRDLLRGLPPHGAYVYFAIEQALADAGLDYAAISDEGTGLFCASAGSPQLLVKHVTDLYAVQGARGHPMGVVSSISGTLNFNFGAWYKILGANCGYVSACTSSAHALGYAVDEIRLGRQDRLIVAAGEDTTADTILPFIGMRALTTNPDPATASRPFDQGADGFVGTGGGVCVIVEEAAVAASRGAPVYAEISGWGQANDGHNVMISHPEGDGLRRALHRALENSGVAPGAVDYVNAHATSTRAGDASEAKALHAVFTAAGATPAISSTKALTGHGLSMAGALETALCALAMREGFIPGCAALENPIPTAAGLHLPLTTENRAPHTVVTNSSGFGGSNVALVLQRSDVGQAPV